MARLKMKQELKRSRKRQIKNRNNKNKNNVNLGMGENDIWQSAPMKQPDKQSKGMFDPFGAFAESDRNKTGKSKFDSPWKDKS